MAIIITCTARAFWVVCPLAQIPSSSHHISSAPAKSPKRGGSRMFSSPPTTMIAFAPESDDEDDKKSEKSGDEKGGGDDDSGQDSSRHSGVPLVTPEDDIIDGSAIVSVGFDGDQKGVCVCALCLCQFTAKQHLSELNDEFRRPVKPQSER